MVFLTGLLPASCHKSQVQQTSARPAVVANATNNAVGAKAFDGNLGEIALTNRSETRLQITAGQICILTPKLLDRQNAQITLTLESKNDHGETRNLAVTQLVAKTGKPLEVTVGDLKLTFTPFIIEHE